MGFTVEKIFIMLIVLMSWASPFMSRTLHEASIAEKHEKWMTKHGRNYRDETEREMRLNIFKQTVEFIEKCNSEGNRTYKLSINEFADLTDGEFQASYAGYNMPGKKISTQSQAETNWFKHPNVTVAPGHLDWRTKGAVTAVKYQGRCAFSAVAAVEGITKIKTGKLISLLEKQVLDCTKSHGCKGGWMDDAFSYIIQSKGLATENIYPYEQREEGCNRKREVKKAARIRSYKDVPANEEALLKAVAIQPVSVAIPANETSFKYYKGSVFNGPCKTAPLDHAVTVVGYGATNGMKYWLVKNSWGKNWGEGGYIRMHRGVGGTGLCGIASGTSFPIA